MPDLTHLLEQSEAICTTRFAQLDKAALEPLPKKEAAQQGYLYGFEDALELLQTMLDEGIEPPKRVRHDSGIGASEDLTCNFTT